MTPADVATCAAAAAADDDDDDDAPTQWQLRYPYPLNRIVYLIFVSCDEIRKLLLSALRETGIFISIITLRFSQIGGFTFTAYTTWCATY